MTDASSEHAAAPPKRPFLPHAIRLLAVPIILFWVVLTVIVNTIAPPLEVVGEQHSAPMAPEDAPSMQAMMRLVSTPPPLAGPRWPGRAPLRGSCG